MSKIKIDTVNDYELYLRDEGLEDMAWCTCGGGERNAQSCWAYGE